jgi:hypothetical protein
MKTIILLLAVLLVSMPDRVEACSCIGPSMGQEYSDAKAVFIGAVTEDKGLIPLGGISPQRLYMFTVERIWKGPKTRYIPVAVAVGPGESCGIGRNLTIGDTMVIFGHGGYDGDMVGLNACTRWARINANTMNAVTREVNYLAGGQWIGEGVLGAAAIDNDDWNPGLSANAALRYTILPHLSLRARIAYSYLPFMFERKLADPEGSSGRGMQVLSASVEGMFRLFADHGSVSLYIAAGAGMMWYDVGKGIFQFGGISAPVEGSSGSAPGIFGGIGLDVPLGGWLSLFLEGQASANLREVPMNRVVFGLVWGVQVLL